jgi:hypothetical protein
MPRIPQSNNRQDKNQHQSLPLHKALSKSTLALNIIANKHYAIIVEQHPNLPDLIQQEINQRTQQKRIPLVLKKNHGIDIR